MAVDSKTREATTYPRGFSRDTDWKWPMVPARMLVTLNYGRALKADTRSLGKVPVFGTNGQCGWHDIPLAKAPGLILGRKGQGPLGVEWCDRDFWVIDTAYYVSTLIPNVDLKYLYHLIKYVGLNHLKDGTSNPTLSRDTFGSQLFPLPPLSEQRAIAAVLGALDDKIELNRRMNATLESMARALFQSWFVDFDPVRAKLDGRQPTSLDPATVALFPEHFEDSAIGKKPIGWEVTVLETALSVLEVGGRPKGGVGGITSGIPSIGAESIVGVGKFDFGKTKYVPVEYFDGMNKGHIQSHDVLLYKDGGRPGEYEPHVSMFGNGFPFEKCSINEHVYRLRTNERLSQEYLYFWLTSELVLAEMRVKGTGVAIPGLNSTAVRSLTTLVPPRPIIEAFTKHAATLVTRILANSKQSRTLATLRDTLLPKLLSGELSVSNLAPELSS
jgi:type I restriction enzyme S subunit